MKTTLTTLLLAAAVTLTAAATDKPERTLTVSGLGQVSVPPDICLMSFGVETSNPKNASAAYKDNCEVMGAVIRALKASGVQSKDIQTQGLYMRPNYDTDPTTGKRTLSGYTVEQSVFVKVRDLAKVSAVLDSAVAAGANNVGSVEFTVEDSRKFTEEARDEAIRDARTKAEKMAAAVGLKLGDAVSMEEGRPGYGYQGMVGSVSHDELEGLSVGGTGSQLEAGETRLTQAVTVTYELRK